jgi:GTP-binding protein
VGLIGLPNAGKSTLLSVISNAKPEIADYPFTTLTPNLGVVDLDDFGFLAADIPGLIEGASDGKGLGDEFLRHVTRTAVLLHLIDAGSKSPVEDYRVIQAELEQYGHGLAEKPQLLILSKRETVDEATLARATKAIHKIAPNRPLFIISAQTHFGLTEVLRAAVTPVKQARAQAEAESAESALPVIDSAAMPHLWQVAHESGGLFRVSGTRLEGFARRTNFDQPDAVARLRDILRKTGVARELRRQGVADGDIVKIGDQELAWID